MRVGPCAITFRFWRENGNSRWEVLDMKADKGTSKEDMIHVEDEVER